MSRLKELRKHVDQELNCMEDADVTAVILGEG